MFTFVENKLNNVKLYMKLISCQQNDKTGQLIVIGNF